jgi:prevent-host-death family protein
MLITGFSTTIQSHVPTPRENIMQSVSVRELKSNPSTALRDARDDMVVVTNRGEPDAVLIGFSQLGGVADLPHLRQAIAVNLFEQGALSVAAAATFAGEPLGAMLSRLAALGIPVVDYSAEELADEIKAAQAWLRPAR